MKFWTVAVFVLASLSAIRARFICPVESSRSYFVDASTSCQVYHFCEDGAIETLICPTGKAFDTLTSTCELAENVACSQVLSELGSGYETPESNSTDLVVPDNHTRTKRGAAFLNFVYTIGSPVIKSLVRMKAQVIFGTDCTVTSKVILPIIFEMLDYEPSRYDLYQVFITSERVLLPIKLEVLRQGGGLFAMPGTVVDIPIRIIEDAMYEIVYNTQPYLIRLSTNHFSTIHSLVVANLHLIQDSIRKLKEAKYAYAKQLEAATFKFASKHKSLAKTSTDQYFKMYSIREILNDFVPVGKVFVKIAVEYLRKFPNSIVNVFERGQMPFFQAPVYRGQHISGGRNGGSRRRGGRGQRRRIIYIG